jgi:hypothetical protein
MITTLDYIFFFFIILYSYHLYLHLIVVCHDYFIHNTSYPNTTSTEPTLLASLNASCTFFPPYAPWATLYVSHTPIFIPTLTKPYYTSGTPTPPRRPSHDAHTSSTTPGPQDQHSPLKRRDSRAQGQGDRHQQRLDDQHPRVRGQGSRFQGEGQRQGEAHPLYSQRKRTTLPRQTLFNRYLPRSQCPSSNTIRPILSFPRSTEQTTRLCALQL